VSLVEAFDRNILHCAFRKLNYYNLEKEAWNMSYYTVTWLLVNKISSEGDTSYGDLITTVRHAAQSIVYWKACDSDTSVHEEGYWNTVCAVVVAHKGRSWVCKQLKGSLNDSPGLSSLLTRCPPCNYDLPVAAYHGDKLIVKALMKRGADINASNKYLGNALLAAAYGGNTDIVSLLLEYNVNIKGVMGTPLI
jgi:ankyrin repeat protein